MKKSKNMKMFQMGKENIGGTITRIDFGKPEWKDAYATCEMPKYKKSPRTKIVIDPALLKAGKEKDLMRVVIHECTHAAFYCLDDDAVNRMEADVVE